MTNSQVVVELQCMKQCPERRRTLKAPKMMTTIRTIHRDRVSLAAVAAKMMMTWGQSPVMIRT